MSVLASRRKHSGNPDQYNRAVLACRQWSALLSGTMSPLIFCCLRFCRSYPVWMRNKNRNDDISKPDLRGIVLKCIVSAFCPQNRSVVAAKSLIPSSTVRFGCHSEYPRSSVHDSVLNCARRFPISCSISLTVLHVRSRSRSQRTLRLYMPPPVVSGLASGTGGPKCQIV